MTGALTLGPRPSARGDHREAHLVSRTGWLRVAVLGANDGIVSTASLIIGVAASGATFTAGASLPLLVAAMAPTTRIVALEALGSLLFLAALGWLGALAGGAAPARPVARVIFWGALAMAITAGIGRMVGTAA